MNLHLKISVNMHFWFLPDSDRGHTGFMRRLAIQMMYAVLKLNVCVDGGFDTL